MGNMNKGSNI